MEHKKQAVYIGVLIATAVVLFSSLSSALAADTTPMDTYTLTLITSTTKWSYGTGSEVSNDFLETVRTGVATSVREDIGNRGKFGAFEAVVPKLAKFYATPVASRYKDGVLVDPTLDGDVVAKTVPKDYLVKDGDWTISCLFNGCISNTEVNPTELYPKMDRFRKTVVGVVQKVAAVNDRKKLQSFSKSLKKALTGKSTIANEKYAAVYFAYLVVNEKLASMK